jgi:hypothetical protein
MPVRLPLATVQAPAAHSKAPGQNLALFRHQLLSFHTRTCPQLPAAAMFTRRSAKSAETSRSYFWWICWVRAAVLCFALALAVPAFGARGNQPRTIWPAVHSAAPWAAAAALLVLGPLAYVHWVRRRPLRGGYPSIASIRCLSRHELKRLLGESLRLQGYAVEEREPDESGDGVWLVLRKPGQKIVVRYVHHGGAAVGVDAMSELHQIMSSEAATGGLIVTSDDVTPDAKVWMADKPIGLIEGRALLELVNRSRTQEPAALKRTVRREPHLGSTLAGLLDCPLCGAPMVLQASDQQSQSAAKFFGCSVPRCPGTRPA